MNEYLVDARLLHAWTLQYLDRKKFTRLICVGEQAVKEELGQRLINNLPALPVDCVFCRAGELKIEKKQDTLIVFESFRCLKEALSADIQDILVIFVSSWGRPAKYFGNGLYLSREDIETITDLIQGRRKLYYQPPGQDKRLLAEIMRENDAGQRPV